MLTEIVVGMVAGTKSPYPSDFL